ncbi:MAG: hypothetical protein ACM34D_09380, partial [Gemmatimonadota bacterium]
MSRYRLIIALAAVAACAGQPASREVPAPSPEPAVATAAPAPAPAPSPEPEPSLVPAPMTDSALDQQLAEELRQASD